jgi:hypothetical protein
MICSPAWPVAIIKYGTETRSGGEEEVSRRGGEVTSGRGGRFPTQISRKVYFVVFLAGCYTDEVRVPCTDCMGCLAE